jgi:beta-galactosidase
LLSPALGITIEEYSSLGADSSYRVISDKDLAGTAIQYVDWVTPQSAEPMAGYVDQWHMQRFAAVTRNSYDKGKGWYVGAVIAEDAFYDSLIRHLLKDAGIRPEVYPPAGIEASVRQGQSRRLLFLINHTDEPQSVKVPQDRLELLSGEKTTGKIQLDRFDVAVIEL